MIFDRNSYLFAFGYNHFVNGICCSSDFFDLVTRNMYNNYNYCTIFCKNFPFAINKFNRRTEWFDTCNQDTQYRERSRLNFTTNDGLTTSAMSAAARIQLVFKLREVRVRLHDVFSTVLS